MSVQVLIGGVDYTAYTDAPSIDVQDNTIMTHDTATFNIELSYPPELPVPQEAQELIWTVNGNREFGGVVSTVQEIDLGTALQYQLSCVSYEERLNRHLVVNFYDAQTADTLVKSMVGQFTQGGFTTNNVQPSYLVAAKYFNYKSLTDCIKQAADEIQWGWYVDYYKDIHFFPIETFVSPLPNNSLYADGNTDVASWSDLQLTEDGSQKKTRIYVLGFKSRVSTPVTLTFIGDGQTTQFSLGYKPSYHKGDITVTVGGTALTVKRDIAEGTPGQNTTDTTSAYVNYYEKLVRLNYAPAQGVLIQVTMYFLTDTVLMRQNYQASAIAATIDNDGSDGRYEYAHTDPNLTNSIDDTQSTNAAAIAKAEQMLYQYAYPQLQAQFTSYIGGWRSGQYFYLRSQRRMGGRYNGQIMYVQSVEKKLIQATPNSPAIIVHTIQATSTPYLV